MSAKETSRKGRAAATTAIASLKTREVALDVGKLSKETLRYLDLADKRLEAEVVFNPSPYLSFLVSWYAMGIDSQFDVKCLIPIEGGRYIATTHGGASQVHGDNPAIYDAIQLLPINQALEIGTTFSLSVPHNKEPYALTVFSSALTTHDKLPKGILPFNRRNLLLHIKPEESLEMKFRVGEDKVFSVRERTYWWPLPGSNGFVVGTQLGRSPIEYLQAITRQLFFRIEEPTNNRLDFMMKASGITIEEKPAVVAYLQTVGEEILAMGTAAKKGGGGEEEGSAPSTSASSLPTAIEGSTASTPAP
ncbi:MAG: hypothetical protein WC483_02125 [Candidatus Paceibacterota bacterium]